MAERNYAEALKRIFVHEGSEYTNDPADPGGPTRYGITIYDVRKYIKPNATAEDVKALTQEQAAEIYRLHYANPIRFGDLPGGPDYCTLDYTINSGIGRAPKVLQRLVGVTVDGEIGDQTIAYARVRDPRVLVSAMQDERLAFLKGLRTWPRFGGGWSRRVQEVRAAALVMAAAEQSVVPDTKAAGVVIPGEPPWMARMRALMGLYEFPGDRDNPAILAMAEACGGKIKREYSHDAIPWCAMCANYALKSGGQPGDDSLWALDFRQYGVALPGPAIGAIATKTRDGGGHVFFVVGRSSGGQIVGRGGNQSDMVCDEVFDPSVLRYNWPPTYPKPTRVGMDALLEVWPEPKVRKEFAGLPPVVTTSQGKGEVPPVKKPEKVSGPAGAAVNAAAGGTFWDWVQANPVESTIIAVSIMLLVIVGVRVGMNVWRKARQNTPLPVQPLMA